MKKTTLETVTMPDGSVMPLEECMDNLLHTRDIDLYLDTLMAMQDRYLILLSVKDTPAGHMPDSVFNKVHNLGFSEFLKDLFRTYIGVIDRRKIIFNAHNKKEAMPIEYSADIDDIHLDLKSEARWNGRSEIIINGENYSLNLRGINIVVFDYKAKKVIDSANYDSWFTPATFYHKNLELDDKYLDSHIYMPKKYMANLTLPIKISYFSNRKLSVKEVERGIFLPNKDIDGKTYGGVCDEKFNFIAGHQVIKPINAPIRHICGSYSVPPEDIEYLDEEVVYGGSMMNHPGHLIVECFADRVWWLIKNADSNLKVAVTVIWKSNIVSRGYASFVKDYLNAFGIPKDRIIFVQKPTKFKKIIIPDQSAFPIDSMHPYEFTSEYVQVFQHITKRLSPAKYKKIYLTKSRTARKNIMGEEFFIKFFKERGFKIVNPEEHTIKEKAEFMYGADEVVTVDGTNALFAVFCRPSVRLTILSRLRNSWDTVQQLVTEAVGIKEFYLVNASGNFINNNYVHGLTLLCVTEEFKKYVKDVLNEDLEVTTEESLKNCLYEYLAYFAEHYSSPTPFNTIKNQKMLDVLQNVSEVFLDKEFDTSKLDLSTNESNLQNQVKDLDAQKSTLTSQINTLTEENKALKSTKTQMETKIDQLHNDRNKLNAELAEANRQKDETGKKLLEAMGEKSVLVSDIEAKKHQIDALASEKNRLASDISEKTAALTAANRKSKDLEYKCAELENKIIEMEHSRSWRITKPLRSIMWFFRRLFGKKTEEYT